MGIWQGKQMVQKSVEKGNAPFVMNFSYFKIIII